MIDFYDKMWIEGIFSISWNVTTYILLICLLKFIDFVLINIISYMAGPLMDFIKQILNFANKLKTVETYVFDM